MSDDNVILAMDLGTSGMKVALITVSGKVLDWDSEPIKLILTQDGGAEQDPQEWWQAFLKAASRLIARGLTPLENIKAVCCSTQGEGTIPVDNNGNALMNCILWMDMRGERYLKQQFKGLINVTGAGLANTLRWIRITGGMPSMTGKDPAAHMLLIRESYPEVYARTYKFLNVLDFLNLKLTGRYTATYDSILTSWITDNRDPDRVHYDDDLVKRSGVDADKLPEIVKCTDVIGELKCDVAEALGLKPGVKVVGGAIDNTAAAIGAGTAEDFDTHIYIGTSSWMAAHVPFKKTDFVSSMASVPCAVPGRYLLTGLQATAGGNLTFLRDNIIYHKDELLQEADVPDIFKVLDQITDRTPAGSNGVIYTPWIWGERAPVEDRTLRAGIYNLSLNNHREDIIRAFLEGIALNTRWLMDPFEKFIGRKLQRINIVGGGAQSDVWCQIFADVLNVEIRQVSDPVQANARGAAWIGAVGMGELKFADLQALTKIHKTYAPNAANRTLYDDRFAIFKSIYKQMNGIYRKLNS
jgi:xylulokinase